MVEHVSERGLEAHSYSLVEVEDLGKTEAGRRCARSFEDADSGVAEASSARGSGRECSEVEVLRT